MPAKRSTAYSDDNEEDGYRKKRDRNNMAVKKSREKANEKAKATKSRVDKLKDDNKSLESQINMLNSHVKQLKDVLMKDVSPEVHKREVQKIIEEGDDEEID